MSATPPSPPAPRRFTEDWLAVWIGTALLVISLSAVLASWPADSGSATAEPTSLNNPLRPLLAKPAGWSNNPIASLVPADKPHLWLGLLGAAGVSLIVFTIGAELMGVPWRAFAPGFLVVFLLALVALVLAANEWAERYNLEYALWALGLGLLISNTLGTPRFLFPALRTEYYIKTGLVLMGASVLFGMLMRLGPPGLGVAWVVTPIVLVSTYWFGQRVLKIPSRTLNMVISADMSVCGVSAAIATAAACRAKKEELSLAVGISLAFTVLMMVVMPPVIQAIGLNQVVGGAWIGGTIDSSGAVVAAGELVGEIAGFTAVTIKMIQNVLIGVVAFAVAFYWVRYVEHDANAPKPDAREIWRRFPKFILGFLGASIVFSIIHAAAPRGPQIVDATLKGVTETLRSWFFALAFVSIGLESNFRELAKYLKGGKPLLLYVCGQSLNLCLTLAMAWLMFNVVFRDVTEQLLK